MVINGASRRNVGFWVKHLENDKKNDRAELKEVRGLAADNLGDALREMQEDAKLTRCKNFMYQANFNPCEHEHLTEQQWEKVFEIFEKHRGIPAGQPRVVYEHEKEGRTHRHVIWSRVDLEHMRAWPDGLDAKICHAAAREISLELGLQLTPSPFDKDRNGERPPRAPKSWEMFRGLRSGIDPRDITAEVTRIFRDSVNASDFVAGLRQHGYQLAQGNRRDFCVLDNAGDVHSLARRLEGVNAKELRTFMRGIDRGSFPTVEEARLQYQERMLAERQADLATVQREIAWEQSLVKAAIEKEKVARSFVEPSERLEIERQAFRDLSKVGILNREAPAPPPKELSFIERHIWTDYHASNSPHSFVIALADHRIALAIVTKAEADRSHREAEFAKAIGNYAPRYREAEIVAVTEPGPTLRREGQPVEARRIYRLNERTIGDHRDKIEQFLEPVRTKLTGIDATKEMMNLRGEDRAAFWETIRLESAQRLRDGAPMIGKGIRVTPILGAAERISGKALKALDMVGNALESVLAPVLTPEQKREGAQAQRERAADAADTIDFSQYLADRELARKRQEREQEGARERQRDDRDR